MLAIDADIAHPYTLLSEIACIENEVEKGIEFCRRGLALKPNKHDASKLNYNLAVIFNQQGRFAEAIKHYSDALKHLPDQPEVLIKWADIVTESFTPGSMKSLGLDYEEARKIKPDVIYFSTCQMGQKGPFASFGGYGAFGVTYAGYSNLTGWPDRGPLPIFNN